MATGGFLRAAILPAFLVHSSLGISLFPFHAVAAESARVDVVLSNLPAHETRGYRRLQRAAGRPKVTLQQMTRSEVWHIPRYRLLALRAAAHMRGVKIDTVPPGPAPLFAPMSTASSMSAKQHEMISLDMGSRATMSVGMARTMDAAMTEHALTAEQSPGAPPPVLRIPLNASTSVAVRRTSLVKTGDRYAWRGEVEGTDEPVTLLWWPDGHVSGTIRHDGRVFTVKSATRGMHEIVEVAPKMLPPDHAPATLDLLRTMNMQDDPLVRQGDAAMMRSAMEKAGMGLPRARPADRDIDKLKDAPIAPTLDEPTVKTQRPTIDKSQAGGPVQPDIVITLLAAYTPAVARRYEDPARDLVELAVEEANQSFRNSGLGFIRVELVHAYETQYAETGSHFDHVWRFADKGDGYMEEVHALRDRYKADVAMLFVHDPMGCGLATRVLAEADEAFAVVHHECATSMYSLAHEIGHIIGARHDYALDSTVAPFPFGHGYVFGTKWRTMMSYKDTCNDCPRLPVWSSPAVTVKGIAAGSERHNNAKVIAEQAARVAGFR